MKQGLFEITEHVAVAKGVYRLVLSGDASAFTAPGQFLNIRIGSLFLRRPISVYDTDFLTSVTVLYRVVGEGTRALSAMTVGETLDVLTGLGNGYDLADAGASPLLIGGGIGIPPLYLLAKLLVKQGLKPQAVLGFNSATDVICEDAFSALGLPVTVTTVDGSYGVRGYATDALPTDYTYFYSCGPEPMLKAVYKITKTSGQFSFEERMGCGFGACMGCSCKTVTGYKRICRDGPVLKKEEILWNE